ncbi:MAG: GNAT family N-acetyltransferase [Opitutaceae bacterium]|nr:GNAT family N-acetyltransferase [Opitutaceae bacterium]
MNWDELNGDDFPAAVASAQGVCLVPLSCIERHAHHMPLGTDMLIAREFCRRAAAVEPVIVAPEVVFTQIVEARHCAGTIAIEPSLVIQLLDNLCRELARNGLRKILLVNAHGGNNDLLRYFVQPQLGSPRDYVVYVANPHTLEADRAAIEALWSSSDPYGHAGEYETSLIQVVRPDLVLSGRIKADSEGEPRNRIKAVRDAGLHTGIWWYADYPTHYAGNASGATAQKGEAVFAARARALVAAIQVVKQDRATRELQDEFFAASAAPLSNLGIARGVEQVADADVDASLDRSLRELLSLCFTQPGDVVFKERRYYAEPPAQRWFIRGSDGSLAAHVAVHDKVVSAAGMNHRIGGVAEVAVHPAQRGHGHVRTLLAAAHAWMVRQGFEYAVLFAHHPNIYASSGYREVNNLFRAVPTTEGAPAWERADKVMVAEFKGNVWPSGEVRLSGPLF